MPPSRPHRYALLTQPSLQHHGGRGGAASIFEFLFRSLERIWVLQCGGRREIDPGIVIVETILSRVDISLSLVMIVGAAACSPTDYSDHS